MSTASAPLPIADNVDKHPIWWEDVNHGDVVIDQRGWGYQVIEHDDEDRQGNIELHVYAEDGEGNWERGRIVRGARDVCWLIAVTSWMTDEQRELHE